ncbi:hypothetical protein BGW37DRAFT_504641 [Umbelopsis sp. PMI_123]|jgi:hypothetical protein|nr:hypothetical protein BGW37DRAFT_504641 [Umbelopsis sp. PMI_123]
MAQEQTLQLRLRVLTRDEYFAIAALALFVSHVVLGWFPTLDAATVSSRKFTSLIQLIFNLAYSVSLAGVSSALFTFSARVLGIPDLEKLNVAPLGVAASGAVAGFFLFQAILGGSSWLAWFFLAIDSIILKIALYVATATLGAGIYGWIFQIGRDKRQVTGLANKTQ